MPVITVSGHSRKVGKTSIAEGLIAALPEYCWTALKVSSHRHCGDFEKDCAVFEETGRDGGNDTSRFLRAGARRAFRIIAEQIETAIPALRDTIKDTHYVVIEGNSVLDYIAADFSILVLNGNVAEFKESARNILSRADVFVLIRENAEPPEWENLLEAAPKNIRRFETPDPRIFPPALTELLRSRFIPGEY
ncbi:MAG: hypothetical protein FWF13_04025 [Acidobacteria bacterium]|nr:hypothetical protein [Acidobacteriota bacterium]